jgi:hypothetical protein
VVVSVVTCPKCRYRFNYRYIPGVSLSAVRLGISRYFRCPHCHERALFDLALPGPDPMSPNYSDPLGWSFAAFLAFAIGGPVLVVLAPRLVSTPSAIPEFRTAVVAVLLLGLVSMAAYTLFQSKLRAEPVS